MKAFASTFQVVVAILLSLLILLQQKGDGLGSLGGGIGGGGELYATKRGAEKVIYRLTVVLAFLFCLNAFVFPFLPDSE